MNPAQVCFSEEIRLAKPDADHSETLRVIKVEVRDLPAFYAEVLTRGEPNLMAFMTANFPELQPRFEYLNLLNDRLVKLLKEKHHKSYLDFLHRDFQRNFGKVGIFYSNPSPLEPPREIIVKKEPTPVGELEIKFEEECIDIGGQKIRLLDTLGECTFEFPNSRYHFRKCFVFDRNFVSEKVLYSELYISEHGVQEVKIDPEMLKNAQLRANPHRFDYIHSLDLSNDVAKFCSGAGQNVHGCWGGTFVVENNKYDEVCLKISYTEVENRGKKTSIGCMSSEIVILSLHEGTFSFTNYVTCTFRYKITFEKGVVPGTVSRDQHPNVFYFG